MRHKSIKRILLSLFVITELLLLNIYPAIAASIPSVNSIAAKIEKRYNLNLASMQDQGQNFNVASTKNIAPQVMLSFNPVSPTLGEKITANAAPLYFSNPKESLYYTWYLKHNTDDGNKSRYDGTLKRTIDCDGDGNCDLNADGDIDVQDWKIEAMRILASNGFDWNRALGKDSSKCDGSANEPEYCTLNNQYASAAGDSDGYSAIPGGNDRLGMPAHCYIHDFTTGTNYELVKQPPGSSVSCADLGDGITRTPVCVSSGESVSSGSFNNGDGDSFSSGNTCNINSGVTPTCYSNGGSSATICSDGSTPLCVDQTIIGNDPIANVACSSLATGNGTSFDTPTCTSNSSVDNNSTQFMCSLSNGKHIFAYPRKESPSETGDNSFGKDEEKFWHTNPNDPNTADNGNVDEANIAGLGQYNFSWNYQPGDKVGVAVEGLGNLSTKYDDSSVMIMWALPKNKCNISYTGSYTTSVKGYNIVIPITSISKENQDDCIGGNCLNNCLEDNLVDPQEGGQSAKLDVSLSYSPENPVNDPSGNNAGDALILDSSVTGAKDNNYLKYAWEIYSSDNSTISSDDGDWTQLRKSTLSGINQTSGIGLKSISFDLNFTDSKIKFLKVRLGVTENITNTIANEGSAEVIIPISSSSNKIQAYPAIVSDGLTFSKGTEMCSSSSSLPCAVLRDQIIEAKVNIPDSDINDYDFAWTIDGNPFIPFDSNCSSGECSKATGENTNLIYFPILKEVGEQYVVNLAANKKNSGEKINLTRIFLVSDPAVAIISKDETTCRPDLLGYYVDLNGKSWPDYSGSNYTGLVNSVITLSPLFNNTLYSDVNWKIDGSAFDSAANAALTASVEGNAQSNNALAFTDQSQTGSYHSIEISAKYFADLNTRKALNKYWGIQLNQFYEKQFSNSIEIKMAEFLDNTQPTGSTNTPKRPIASLFVGISSYFSFLFRIVLTVFLMFAVISLLFSFFPRTNENKIY